MPRTYAQTKGSSGGGGGTFPKFSVNLGGTNQTGNTSGVFNPVVFNTIVYDTNSNFDTSTGKFTPTVAGFYAFKSWVYQLGIIPAGGFGANVLYKNGSPLLETFHKLSAGSEDGTGGAWSCEMNGAGDFVQLYAYFDISAGLNYTISGAILDTWWMGERLP